MNNLSNSVRLTGRLGAAPEMKELENEKKVAKISLATHYYRKNGKGETVEEPIGTSWCFGTSRQRSRRSI